MVRMIKTEMLKLRRYHIIWAGVLLMLLSDLLTLFSSTALDGTVWNFAYFTEQVIKNNVTTIFPVCITLIAGYIIAREEKDDTLKSIMTVPVSYNELLFGKAAVCALLSLFFGVMSTVFTVLTVYLAGFPGIDVVSVLQACVQITLNCLFLYIAMTPVILIAVRIPNGHMVGTIIAFVYGYGGMFVSGNMTLANLYPVTASMGLINYRSYDAAVHWNVLANLCSLFVAFVVSALLIMTAKGNAPTKSAKAAKKKVTKKGW
ncbi:MAG: ABC transporter permease [Lachnospiraceae bacterium]|nr:ABC transporter permease [Lachnospiraceae bacterium]